MAIFNKFSLVVGDTAKILQHTCLDQDQEPIDLTDATVRLKFRIGDGDWRVRLMVVYGTPTDGVVRYQWVEGDLDDSGTLQYEVEIENLDGSIASNDDWQYLEVRPEAT
jgi:hypothetical protein